MVVDLCNFLQWYLACEGVIMAAGELAVLICSPCFDLAPARFLVEGLAPLRRAV
jgi:hypothetical protein